MIPMGGISRRVSREVHLDIYTGYIVDPVWAYGPNTIGCDMYRFILDEYAPFNISTHLPNTISHTPPTRQPARPLPHPLPISESPFSFLLPSFHQDPTTTRQPHLNPTEQTGSIQAVRCPTTSDELFTLLTLIQSPFQTTHVIKGCAVCGH